MAYVNFSIATNDAQRKTLEGVERYMHLYNTDIERFVPECYTDDYVLYVAGGEFHGYDQFLKIECGIKKAVPGRRMAIDKLHLVGDTTVVLEMIILDTARPDWFEPLCVILDFRDGKIVEDRSYIIPQTWPGLDSVAQYVTPGGLGSKLAKKLGAGEHA